MNVQAKLYGVRLSAQKGRLVADLVRGQPIGNALNILTFTPKKGAKIIAHTEDPDAPLAKMSDAVYVVKAPEGVDPYGMIATGSSLVNAAACDVLCLLLLELRGYTKEQFGTTHPEGAVGRKIAEGK